MKFFLFIFLFFINVYAQNIYATFDVVALKSANLAFSTGGIIKDIKVDIGSVVKQDDILASLENEDLKASLQIVKTTQKFAKKDLDRQEKVKSMIDEAKYDSYKQAYESARAQVEYQEKILDKTYLKAPFDGVIISKELEVGDVVSGQMIKTIFTIESKSKRKLILQFDQKYHNTVKENDKFIYKVDGDSKEYEATIYKIYPYANKQTRKISAEVLVDDVMTGLFGDGYIIK